MLYKPIRLVTQQKVEKHAAASHGIFLGSGGMWIGFRADKGRKICFYR